MAQWSKQLSGKLSRTHLNSSAASVALVEKNKAVSEALCCGISVTADARVGSGNTEIIETCAAATQSCAALLLIQINPGFNTVSICPTGFLWDVWERGGRLVQTWVTLLFQSAATVTYLSLLRVYSGRLWTWGNGFKVCSVSVFEMIYFKSGSCPFWECKEGHSWLTIHFITTVCVFLLKISQLEYTIPISAEEVETLPLP